MNPEIIQWLTSHPEVHNVYFRADGSWCFEPRAEYEKIVSRAEALGETKEEIKKSLKSKEKE